MDKSCESCYVCRVEDNYDMLNIRAIFFDVVTKLSGNLAVSLEKVFTCHAFLTRSTTRRNDILSTRESLFWIHCVSYVSSRECALLDFIKHTVYTWLIDIVKTNVWSQTKHQYTLNHV